MPDAPMRVFISYSRADRDFALRLQASLQARGIDAWVDLRRLEGGQEFDRKIEEAINRCSGVLVVLSPDSVASQWVRSEIVFAQRRRKTVIPLMLRETDVPITLATIEYLPFTSDYEEGLKELLIALYRIDVDTPPAESVAPENLPEPASPTAVEDAALSTLVPPVPPLPPPDPDLNGLYLAGIEAEIAGDLERAAILWQQVLDRQPRFRGGQVEEDMAKLAPRLHESRMRNTRARAETAVQEGRWLQAASAWQELADLEPADKETQANVVVAIRRYGQESQQAARWNEAIGAWQAILRRNPADTEAREYLEDAQRNREQQPLYDDARRAVSQEKPDVARVQLAKLYEKARHYGDPEGVAKAVGIAVPPTLAQVKEEAARRAERERLEQEAARRAARRAERLEQEAARRAERERIEREAVAWAEKEAARRAEYEKAARDQAERDRIAREQAENEGRAAEQAQLERVKIQKAQIETRNLAIDKRDVLREEIYSLKAREVALKRFTHNLTRGSYGCAIFIVVSVEIAAAIITLVINVIGHRNVFGVTAIIAGAIGVMIVIALFMFVTIPQAREYGADLLGIPDKMKPLVEQKSMLDDDIWTLDETIGDWRDPTEETFEAWQARTKKQSGSAAKPSPDLTGLWD